MEATTDLVNHLKQQVHKQLEYIHRLERSVAIQSLVPDAFQYGPVEITSHGNVDHPDNMTLVIQTSRPDTHRFELMECPVILWENTLREICKQHKRTPVHEQCRRMLKEHQEQRAMQLW